MKKRYLFDFIVVAVVLPVIIASVYLTKKPPLRGDAPLHAALTMLQFQQKFLVGVVSNRLYRVDRAYKYLESASLMKPGDDFVFTVFLEAERRRALEMYHQGRYPEVLQLLESHVDGTLPPTRENYAEYLLAGMTLLRTGRADEALLLAERLASVFPTDIHVITFLYRTMLAVRGPRGAFETLTPDHRRLLEESGPALLTAGDLAWNGGDFSLAVRCYCRGLEREVGNPAFLYRLGSYEVRVMRDLRAGQRYLLEALLRDPSYPGLQKAYWSSMTNPRSVEGLAAGTFPDSRNISLALHTIADNIGVIMNVRRSLMEDMP